ncbi:MAG: helix-turn-helix domain-containing protein [Brevibacillus sp.]|nr:helix-turn-helix domain-containing protein [Brevibacillus sp.]
MTTLPVSIPRQLGAAMQRFAGLRQALQQYLPQVMIAATWQHALEQWAASLSPDTAKALAASLKPHVGAERLSADQIEIVETFCAHNLNVSETARALFLHRNTLLYRLDKLTEQTGLDIRNAADALLLRLALLFRQND